MKSTQWDERQWERIADEFDEKPYEVVRVMHHEQHVPLCHVAGALYISESTLRRWCKMWGLETRHSGYIPMKPRGKVERRAIELGYADVPSAITAMRQGGMRWDDVKAALGCGDSTMSRYLRNEARGYYHLSEHGRWIKSETRRRLNAEGKKGEMPDLKFVVGGADCASRL